MSYIKNILTNLLSNFITTIISVLFTDGILFGIFLYIEKEVKKVLLNPLFWILLAIVSTMGFFILYSRKKIQEKQSPSNYSLPNSPKTFQIDFLEDFFTLNFTNNYYNYDEVEYVYRDFDGLYCRKCKNKLHCKQTLLGEYIHYCPLDNIKLKSDFSDYSIQTMFDEFFKHTFKTSLNEKELKKLVDSKDFNKQLFSMLHNIFPKNFK